MTLNPEDARSDASLGGQTSDAGRERIFLAKRSTLAEMGRTWALGLALVGVWAVLLVMAAHTRATAGNPFQPGLGSGFIAQLAFALLGGFTILRGVFLLRTTRRAVLSPEGIQVNSWLFRRFVPWSSVKRIKRTTRPVPFADKTIQAIELASAGYRPLALIFDTLEGFEALAKELTTLDLPRDSSQGNDDDSKYAMSKERVRLRWMAFGFLFFAIGSAGALIAGIDEEWHTRQMATQGVVTEATVLKAWMVRITPWVKYSFQDASGRTFVRETTMYEGAEWEYTQTAKTIPVIYLRSDPEWSRVKGESGSAQFGGNSLIAFAGGLLLCTALFITSLLGYNLKTEGGVTYVTRYGAVIKERKSAGANQTWMNR